MNNDNNIKRSLIILNKIENIRGKNNKNWMDIVRLSIKLDYKKTSKLIKEIYKYDTQISALAKKIYKK
jgi:hypothetical protein